MRKIKDLETKDFPGADEEKFQVWKEAQLKYIKQSNIIAAVIFGAIILLLLFRDQLLPALIFGLSFLAGIVYIIPSIIKIKKLQKAAGIDSKDLKKRLRS